MRAIPIVIALTLTLATCAMRQVEAKPFSCANVPWWVHNYSRENVATVADELGMTPKQIRRLLRCFVYTQDKGIGP